MSLELSNLGATDMLVSPLALGTVKFGRSQGVKYPDPVIIPDDAAVRDLLACAKSSGINLIDTAPAYGNSEARLGHLLPSRQQWIISTKVGEQFIGSVSRFDFSGQACHASIEESLRRLRTDYIDIALIHSDGNDVDILENTDCLSALQECKKQGKIRAYGISHKTVAGAELAIDLGVDVIMATLNPSYLEEVPVIERAAQAGVGVLIKKALQSGHGSREGLRLAARQSGVSSIVVGTTNPSHLRANAELVANARSESGRR